MRNGIPGRFLCLAAVAALVCACSTAPAPRTLEKAADVDLPAEMPYVDTRVVVMPDCPVAPANGKGRDPGKSFAGLLKSPVVGPLFNKAIDLGIDAIDNYLKKQAEPSSGNVQGMSNSYLWVNPQKKDLYLGCVVLFRGQIFANPTAAFLADERGARKYFSENFWQKKLEARPHLFFDPAGEDESSLNLAIARDPDIYLEAHAVASLDGRFVSFVPAYFFYGAALDNRGSDAKTVKVQYSLLSPTGPGQTLYHGGGSFELPLVAPPLEVNATGFGLKHTPWIGLIDEQPPGHTDAAGSAESRATSASSSTTNTKEVTSGEPGEPTAIPGLAGEPTSSRASPNNARSTAAGTCLPFGGYGAQNCVKRGTFHRDYSGDTRAGIPVVVQVALTETGEASPVWKFISDVFSGAKGDVNSGIDGLLAGKATTSSDTYWQSQIEREAVRRQIVDQQMVVAKAEEDLLQLEKNGKSGTPDWLKKQSEIREAKLTANRLADKIRDPLPYANVR